MTVLGDELDGDDIEGDVEIVGVRRNPRTGRQQIVKRYANPQGAAVHLPPKPSWRKGQWGPGVSAPKDDRLIVPFTPLAGGGTFTAALQGITYLGEPQKPFRGERLLVSVIRTGASSTGRLMALLFAGTDLQQGDVARFDIELVGQAGSFDTYITTTPVEPGVKLRFDILIQGVALANADTIFLTMQMLGSLVH